MASKKTKAPKDRAKAARARAKRELDKQEEIERRAAEKDRRALEPQVAAAKPALAGDPDALAFEVERRIEAQENLVLQSLAREVPKGNIVAALTDPQRGFGIGISAAKALIKRIEDSWIARAKGTSREVHAAKAQTRVMAVMRKAEAEGDVGAMLRAEEVLMDLQGTKAPEEIHIKHTSLQIYMDVFAVLEEKEIDELVEEGVVASRALVPH